jgi:hypothetical protein
MNVAWSLAVDLAFALHPKVWRWANEGKRKAAELPVWKRVARAVLAGVLIGAVSQYFRYSAERLKEEDPELWARIHADAEARRR